MVTSGKLSTMLLSDQLEHASESGSTVAGVPLDTTNSTSGVITPKHALKLPSFEALGIANLHPDGSLVNDITPFGACSIGRFARQPANITLVPGFSPHPAHLIPTLTPPCESSNLLWSHNYSSLDHATSLAAGGMAGSEHIPFEDDGVITPRPTPQGDAVIPRLPGQEGLKWFDSALASLLCEDKSTSRDGQTFKVLSHALPCPSTEGHVFTRVMSALYEHSMTRKTAWINVFHALPGRFSLNDLPTSPPATPGQPLQNEDYFTQKVFDSAVTVADYHTNLSLLPRSTKPVVPPGTVDVAVVERYIPPTSTMEFATMFDTNAPSILVDRLVELSPDYGSLLFIYPTRTGALTFANDYLSPILDPLLRTLASIHSLPMASCSAFGKPLVSDELLEHADAHRRLSTLCGKLSHTSQHSVGTQRSTYQVVHASAALIHPSRQVWAAQWWAKQEKERLREEVTKWTQDARSRQKSELHRVERPASAEILRQLLDGITSRPYRSGQEPSKGIEVNVFVVRRT